MIVLSLSAPTEGAAFEAFEREFGGGVVAPGGKEGFLEGTPWHFAEEDAGAALTAPGASDGEEGCGRGGDELFLLDWSELDHAVPFVGIAEGREDLSCHPEVGMVHVPALLSFRESQGYAAEFGGCQGHSSLDREASEHKLAGSDNVGSGGANLDGLGRLD